MKLKPRLSGIPIWKSQKPFTIKLSNYLVLNEMVSSVFSVLVSLPEDGLAAVVLAVEVLQVLDGATLEPAALAGVEVQHVVLPSVLRNLIKIKTN